MSNGWRWAIVNKDFIIIEQYTEIEYALKARADFSEHEKRNGCFIAEIKILAEYSEKE